MTFVSEASLSLCLCSRVCVHDFVFFPPIVLCHYERMDNWKKILERESNMKDKQTHEMTLNVFSVITLNTQTKLEKHLSQSQIFECTRQLISPSDFTGKCVLSAQVHSLMKKMSQ